MAYEERKESCNGCEFLIQDGTPESPSNTGRCVRFAPTELAAKTNKPIGGPIPELFPFRAIAPIDQNWCGEFKPSSIDPLPVIP